MQSRSVFVAEKRSLDDIALFDFFIRKEQVSKDRNARWSDQSFGWPTW